MVGGNPVVSQSRQVDFQGRTSSVVTRNGGGEIIKSVGYGHDAMDRRTEARREDGTSSKYGYNDRGEVTKADRRTAGGVAIDGLERQYSYDAIGNRIWAKYGGGQNGALSEINYTVNPENQYTTVSTPGKAWVVGRAPEGDDVDVNGAPAGRQETWFSRELTVDNATGPAYPAVEVRDESAALAEQGEGHLSVPKAVVSPTYDPAGNLTEDSRWHYEWDSQNRLKRIYTSASAATAGFPVQFIEFVYDWQGRRIAKLSGENGTAIHTRYLYEQWNVVAEWKFEFNPPVADYVGPLPAPQTYLWGLDLSGQTTGDVLQLQSAGGVGGLLAAGVVRTSDSANLGNLYAAYDGNGNILAWLGADGQIKRSQDYDAFGNVVLKHTTAAGPLSSGQGELTYGFSSKPEDKEIGMIYYGYRYYDSKVGKWISRDPIEEDGGPNLYCLIENKTIDNFDVLGEMSFRRNSNRIPYKYTSLRRFASAVIEGNLLVSALCVTEKKALLDIKAEVEGQLSSKAWYLGASTEVSMSDLSVEKISESDITIVDSASYRYEYKTFQYQISYKISWSGSIKSADFSNGGTSGSYMARKAIFEIGCGCRSGKK